MRFFSCSFDCVWRPLWLLLYLSCVLWWNRFDDLSVFHREVTIRNQSLLPGGWAEACLCDLLVGGAGGEMRLFETSGPLECQRRRGGAPAHDRHISSRSSHLSAGVQGLSVHVLDECLRPHRVLVSVFGTTTVLLTTFCSLLIWFSPRLALFHAALFALYFRILLLKLFLSSCLFCLPAPLLLFFPHFHPVLF